LFSALRGTLFDNYCLKTKELCLDPTSWEALLTPKEGKPWEKNVEQLCGGLDQRFRPDIICLLQRIGNPKDVIPLTVGARCHSSLQSKIDFCKNLMTTDLSRAYLNDYSEVLDSWNRAVIRKLYDENFKGKPSLRIAFVYGGVTKEVDTTIKTWNDATSNAQYLIIDSDNKGLKELLPKATSTLLDMYCFSGPVQTASLPSSTAVTPQGALQNYKDVYIPTQLVQRASERILVEADPNRRKRQKRKSELTNPQLEHIDKLANALITNMQAPHSGGTQPGY